MSSTYVPGGSSGNLSCPLSLVVVDAGQQLRSGEGARTLAPGSTAPCSSLSVPTRAPVRPCACAIPGNSAHPTHRSTSDQRSIHRVDVDLLAAICCPLCCEPPTRVRHE